MKFSGLERRPRGFSDVQDYHIRTESRRGKKENPRISVDAALSLGCFIKLLVTFESDGGEEVRLGGCHFRAYAQIQISASLTSHLVLQL